jgi:methionine synthase I (cobalamin-dependent)
MENSIPPDADSPLVKGEVTVYEQSPDEFAQDIMRIVEASTHVIGGCYGNPPFIDKARQRLFDRR